MILITLAAIAALGTTGALGDKALARIAAYEACNVAGASISPSGKKLLVARPRKEPGGSIDIDLYSFEGGFDHPKLIASAAGHASKVRLGWTSNNEAVVLYPPLWFEIEDASAGEDVFKAVTFSNATGPSGYYPEPIIYPTVFEETIVGSGHGLDNRLYEYDIALKTISQTGYFGQEVYNWYIAGTGRPVARVLRTSEKDSFNFVAERLVRDDGGEAWKPIALGKSDFPPRFLLPLNAKKEESFDTGYVELQTDGYLSLAKVRLSTGKVESIAARTTSDMTNVALTEDNRRLMFVSWSNEEPSRAYFEDRARSEAETISGDTVADVTLLSSTLDGKTRLYRSYSAERGSELFMSGDGRPTRMSFGCDAKLQPTTIRYVDETKGSSRIRGFLYTPKEHSVGRILYLHGGPEDHVGYEPYGQISFLLESGYEVFALNYRGSTGYGLSYLREGNLIDNQLEDAVAALEWLNARGTQQDGKAIVWGESFGGHLAVRLAAKSPDAVSSLLLMSPLVDARPVLNRQRLAQSQAGLPFRRDKDEWDTLKAAADVKVRVLVVHGVKDNRVPLADVEKLVGVLTSAGSEVEFVKLPTLSHELVGISDLQLLLDPVAKYLASDQPH